jgi:hypothetical protein
MDDLTAIEKKSCSTQYSCDRPGKKDQTMHCQGLGLRGLRPDTRDSAGFIAKIASNSLGHKNDS